MKLKSLTETSWIVLDNQGDKVGILTRTKEKLNLMTPGGSMLFDTQDDANTFFGEDIFSNIVYVSKTEEVFELDGWPVSTANPVKAQSVNNLPCYTKTEGGKSIHCAGYYSIKFPGSYINSFCPKLSTLEKYEFSGPFKTELEARATTSINKK
ncbi:hypothetical protein Cassandra_0125 [Pseudomonas phage Cassandra]|nr:hypothetical protein Cassandra_0125 [Pseudomonas phage Cassandra]